MTDGREQNPVRRPVVVTAFLLVAVAVMLVALRSWLDRPAGEIDIDREATVAAEAEPVQPAFEPEPVVEPDPAVEPVVVARPSPEQIDAPVLVFGPTDPTTIVMLPARVASADPEAAAVTEAVRQSTLRVLHAMPSIRVIEVSSAEQAAIGLPNAGPLMSDNLVYLVASRRHEAPVVAEISEQTAAESPFWSLILQVRRPSGGGGYGDIVVRNGLPRMGGDVESVSARFAEHIASDAERVARESSPASLPGAVAAVAEARSFFLDTFRSEAERLQTLSQLLNGPPDLAVIAAAVEMATRSPSAETRRSVWTLLRRSAYDTALAQPLSYSLLSDADAAVRKEAALALAAYAGDAAAAAALANAARNDSSPEVRLAARMASMDFEEKKAFQRTTLLDRSLTPAERLAPTIVDASLRRMNTARTQSAAAALEEALAYAEIVTAIEGAEPKLRVLSELQMSFLGALPPSASRSSTDDANIVASVIETSRHEDERVRRAALNLLRSLTQLRGNAEARAELESVLENEPDLAAELRIAEALASRPLLSAPAR